MKGALRGLLAALSGLVFANATAAEGQYRHTNPTTGLTIRWEGDTAWLESKEGIVRRMVLRSDTMFVWTRFSTGRIANETWAMRPDSARLIYHDAPSVLRTVVPTYFVMAMWEAARIDRWLLIGDEGRTYGYNRAATPLGLVPPPPGAPRRTWP